MFWSCKPCGYHLVTWPSRVKKTILWSSEAMGKSMQGSQTNQKVILIIQKKKNVILHFSMVDLAMESVLQVSRQTVHIEPLNFSTGSMSIAYLFDLHTSVLGASHIKGCWPGRWAQILGYNSFTNFSLFQNSYDNSWPIPLYIRHHITSVVQHLSVSPQTIFQLYTKPRLPSWGEA